MKDIFSLAAPTSVRVARWAAIAAAITAAGSIFETMWSEKPWWADETPSPAPIVRSYARPQSPPYYVHKDYPSSENEPAKMSYSKESFEPAAPTSSPIEKPFHLEKWLFICSTAITLPYFMIEFVWGRIKKRRIARQEARQAILSSR